MRKFLKDALPVIIILTFIGMWMGSLVALHLVGVL